MNSTTYNIAVIGQTHNTTYNIAVIGQTGVGKSSLINYLFSDAGLKPAKTGTGRPVTENGFHHYAHHIKDMPVMIYDSWGLEVGKEAQWQNELTAELKKRGVDQSATEWFHSVLYCIGASGSRIQDADVKIIKQLIDAKYKVSIILTKADTISEDDEQELKKATRQMLGDIPIIAVCSEGKKTRGGETQPFGKVEVEEQTILDLVDSLVQRIPAHCESLMKKELSNWRSEMIRMINNNVGVMGLNSRDVQNSLSSESNSLMIRISNKGFEAREESLKHYRFIAQHLSKELQLSSDSKKRGSSIDYVPDSEFGWSDIALAPLIIVAAPFALIYMAFKGKDDAIGELNTKLNTFVKQIEHEIEKKTIDMTGSFDAIRQKIKEDFTSKV